MTQIIVFVDPENLRISLLGESVKFWDVRRQDLLFKDEAKKWNARLANAQILEETAGEDQIIVALAGDPAGDMLESIPPNRRTIFLVDIAHQTIHAHGQKGEPWEFHSHSLASLEESQTFVDVLSGPEYRIMEQQAGDHQVVIGFARNAG